MAFDKLYIANRMLLKASANTLGAFGKATKTQRLTEAIYDGIVYEVFHLNINWHFATVPAQLNELTPVPIFGRAHQFVYPPGCVRIIKTVDENAKEVNYPYERGLFLKPQGSNTVEIDVLLTDQTEVFVKYVYLRTNPASWPGWFQKVVILSGAKELIGPVKKDDFTMLNIKNDLKLALSEAKGANGAENMKTGRNARTLDAGQNDYVDAAVGLNSVGALGGPFPERT